MNSSTLTLLFTDIVDSTPIWEAHPEAMRDALARHDEILRGAVAAVGGRVIVGTGDGVYAAFSSALSAVTAVVEAQRALLAEPWPMATPLRVRMALHTGEAETADTDPKGPAANRTARLMSLAAGGQILLSEATADLVRDRLPDGIGLRDLGEHALKGITRPERVYQITGPGLPSDFPPLKSQAARLNNLPVQLTPFIGRERERRAVGDLLHRHAAGRPIPPAHRRQPDRAAAPADVARSGRLELGPALGAGAGAVAAAVRLCGQLDAGRG
jgi:class 3 adenylate cyclase